jgi:hypothetical protein
MEAHRKFLVFCGRDVPLSPAPSRNIALAQNPAFSEWHSLKMVPQGCRQGNEDCLQFRVICEVTTPWPVQDINGNKDTRAYEKKNLVDKWISGYRQKGSMAELSSLGLVIAPQLNTSEKSRVESARTENVSFFEAHLGHQV